MAKYKKNAPYQNEPDVLDLHEEYINARANKNRRASKYERKMLDKVKRSKRDRAWN